MRNDLTAFLETIPSALNRGRAASVLSRPMTVDGRGVLPRHSHVERFVAAGATVDAARGTVTFSDGTYLTRRDITDAAVIYAAWLTERRFEGMGS